VRKRSEVRQTTIGNGHGASEVIADMNEQMDAAAHAALINTETPPEIAHQIFPSEESPIASLRPEVMKFEPPLLMDASLHPANEVTVSWGEELFTPAPYNSFRVGPFSIKGVVLPGETQLAAMTRLYKELCVFAEQERAHKFKSYQDAYKALMGNT
jgi:hypothetical protein